MKPSLWGRHYWFVIHVTATKYPEYPSEENKIMYKEFYANLWRFLPCKMCANHYREHWEEIPIDPHLESRQTLFEWTVKLHNTVNASLQKPVMPLAEAIAHYDLPDGGAYKDALPSAFVSGPQEYALHLLMAVNVLVIVLVAAFMVWMWRTRRSM